MKSILNDVNRLEKAWELLKRIVDAYNASITKGYEGSVNSIYSEIRVANAFLEKYGKSE